MMIHSHAYSNQSASSIGLPELLTATDFLRKFWNCNPFSLTQSLRPRACNFGIFNRRHGHDFRAGAVGHRRAAETEVVEVRRVGPGVPTAVDRLLVVVAAIKRLAVGVAAVMAVPTAVVPLTHVNSAIFSERRSREERQTRNEAKSSHCSMLGRRDGPNQANWGADLANLRFAGQLRGIATMFGRSRLR